MLSRAGGLQARARAVAAWALALGLAAGLVLYLLAPAAPEDPLGDPSGSKRYIHDLEVYGGKANVLSDEFRRWWGGLWHGRQLGVTVASLAVLVFLGTHLVLAQVRRPHPRAGGTGGGGT